MFNIGAAELILLLLIAFVVVGPKDLPSTARKIGSYYSKFRRAADSFKRQLMDMDLEMERELRKAEQEVENSMKVPEMTEEPGVPSAGETPDDEPMRDYGEEPADGPNPAGETSGEEVHGD